jgi:hypothetical protein
MYNSDEEHVRAWLACAEQTPGGWRARVAEKRRASGAVATNEPGQPGTARRRYSVVSVEPMSPCCTAGVLVDPLSLVGRLGLCSTCGTLLAFRGTTWQGGADGE